MKNSNHGFITFLLALLLIIPLTHLFASPIFAASETSPSPYEYDWIDGPASVTLDNKATLQIFKDHSFLDKSNTQRSMLNSGSKPNGNEIGSLYSTSENGSWYVVFEYVKTGHIHDHDQNLNAEELLSSYIQGTEEENRELAPEDKISITGWEIEPTYDPTKRQLVYSIGFKDANEQAMVNYNVKFLTREGYITAILVTDQPSFEQNRMAFEDVVLNQLSVNPGNTYEDYDESTDKTSTVGLKSILVGGIGYTAGQKFSILLLFKKGWYVILPILIILFCWLKFRRRKQGTDDDTLSPNERAYLQEADEQQYADQNELSYYNRKSVHTTPENKQ
ncbi:DUF2167 domain-containing protein [Paenibacillus illinoisensis]|uniref:DUF2167 domain-containing protein n=1 Tax=Paenibacillus illinoisensis TaxID=59845 RepID=UPI00301C2216